MLWGQCEGADVSGGIWCRHIRAEIRFLSLREIKKTTERHYLKLNVSQNSVIIPFLSDAQYLHPQACRSCCRSPVGLHKPFRPCGEGFKNMLLSDASTCCPWGLTGRVEEMDLGNGPATVWALSCCAEEPTETMGKGKRTQDSHRPLNWWRAHFTDGCWETFSDIKTLSRCIRLNKKKGL